MYFQEFEYKKVITGENKYINSWLLPEVRITDWWEESVAR